jgi:hypothetical protein
MSEVDRLSNSGLYPALPMAEKRSRKDGPPAEGAPDKNNDHKNKDRDKDRRPPSSPPASAAGPATAAPAPAPARRDDPDAPRPAGSRIDEYA